MEDEKKEEFNEYDDIGMPVLASIDGEMCLVNPMSFQDWKTGRSTMDAIPLSVIEVQPVYSYVKKYPFTKPKVVHSSKKKNSLFSRNGIISYYIVMNDKMIQPRTIKEIKEYNDNYHVSKEEAKHRNKMTLINEFSNIYR